MTGVSAIDQKPGQKVTALDHARQLLTRAKAQKAAQFQPPDPEPTPTPARPTSGGDLAHLTPPTDPAHPTPSGTPSDPAPSGVPSHSARFSLSHSGSSAEPAHLASSAGSARFVPSAERMRRVQQALDAGEVDRQLPTLPAVAELLPGAGLRSGGVYSVSTSPALVMAMMAGPSAEGAWCGVVGMPSFGAEAARGLGVDLERLVLVPDPGQDWLNVVAALVDALTVVVVRPPGEVTPGEASRLAARLRTRKATLISVGSWPGSEARLEVESNAWTGLGDGEGLLSARQATVMVSGRRVVGGPRRHELWLPAPDGTIRPVDPAQEEASGWPSETTWPEGTAWPEEAVG